MFERWKRYKIQKYSKELIELCRKNYTNLNDMEYAASRIETLINKGADINCVDIYYSVTNMSPLLHASAHNNYKIVEKLLQLGADVQYKDTLGENAIAKCMSTSFNINTLVALVDKGADINSQDIYGKTPLHYECEKFYNHTVELLMTYGANANIQDKDGYTPLHIVINTTNACCRMAGNTKHSWYAKHAIQVIDTLLTGSTRPGYNADPNIRDNDGNTPLDLQINNDGNRAISYVMIKAGAVPTSKEIDDDMYERSAKVAYDQLED